MKTKGYIIREEKINEREAVENLVRESFWNVYRPGAYEHYLIRVMRLDESFVNELDLVMVLEGGVIIGQCAFVRSKIDTDDGGEIPTLTLGPICIANEFKRKGYGKILLDYAFDKAQKLGYGAVLFEGNIGFYGKCGCAPASKYGIRYEGLPEGKDASFFLCKILKEGYLDGITGEYSVPKVYFVSDEDVEDFDKNFEPREKLKLPGQLF